MAIRMGINGFGRTGRALLRVATQRPELDIEVVAINDLGRPEALARLLARDSVYGRFNEPIVTDDTAMVVGGHRILLPSEHDVKALPWGALRVDVVVEATGRFTAREAAAGHLDAGAPRVVVSAPSKDADATFVMGVNDDSFDPARHVVVSNASCTTNCFVPLAKVLDDAFGIRGGLMTTVHAYTNDQNLLDLPHEDLRRARAAAQNIVPASSGAARATGLVLPAMQGRLDGAALRVPVVDGSITDFTAVVTGAVTVDEVNEAFRLAATAGPLARVLEYTEDPIVSSDIVGNAASCTFDSGLTMVIPVDADTTLVKVQGWYDNEWGYANRLVDLVVLLGSAGPPPA